MALPVTISGAEFPLSSSGKIGPFISSAGNVYFVAPYDDGVSSYRLGIYKATDPTSSFSINSNSLLGANGLGNPIASLDVTQVGDVLHIAYQRNENWAGTDVGGQVRHQEFNMATDTLGSSTELYTPTDNPTSWGVGIDLRSDGDIIVVYHGENPRNMGGNYQELAYSRREGGTWTNGVVVASTGGKDDNYFLGAMVMGSTDQAHIIGVRDTTEDMMTRALSSGNVLRTLRETARASSGISMAGIFTRSSTEQIFTAYSETGPTTRSHTWDYFDDDSNLPNLATSTLVSDTITVLARRRNAGAAVDAGDTNSPRYIGICRGVTGATIHLYTDSGGTTWSTESTDLLPAAGNNDALSANIFTRGGNVVYAFVSEDDLNVVRYGEYIIRSSGPTTITGTGALTSAAATLSGSGSVFATVSGTGALLGGAGQVAGAGDVFGNIDGSGALQAGAGQVSGSGAIARQGTGALTAPSPYVVAGVGGPIKTGTGSLVAGAATLSASGDIIKTGSGALQAGAGQVSGDGAIVKTGSGAILAGAGQIDGSGNLIKTGSGALTGPSPYTIAGVGGPVKTGTGAIIAAPATLSGLGDIIKTATGALQAAAATLSGDGTIIKVGSGALQAGAGQVSGSGSIVKVGSGALTGAGGEILGAGGVAVLITGDGSLTSPTPSLLAGLGDIIKTGTGDLVVGAATLSGLGDLIKTATGALQAAAAQVAGSGSIEKIGSGAIVSPSGQVAGSGAIGREGSGALIAPAGQVQGGGGIQGEVSGVGAVIAPSGQVAGSGFLARVGTGAIIAPSGQVLAGGTIIKTASGALQAAPGQIAGSGSSGALIAGSGAILAGAGLISAIGKMTRSGSGALTAAGATIDGSGIVGAVTVGTGALIAPGTQVAGLATRSIVGDGVLVAPGGSLSGIGGKVISGSGTLTAAAAIVLGFQDVPIIGVPIIGAPIAPVLLTGAPTAPQAITGAPSGAVEIIGGGQMATNQNIDEFSDGEDIIIELFGKDSEGAALASPAGETIRMNISEAFGGANVLTVDTSPQVVLADAGASRWTITLDATDDLAGVITPGRAYQYTIHSVNNTSGRLLEQARGRLFYKKAIGPFV